MVHKHPEERSLPIGIWVFILFGAWGAHRFYLGQRKAGCLILILSTIAIFAYIFNLRMRDVLIGFAAIVFLLEGLTIYPRIKRHNESLTKHYYDS